jgi:hypothetical protein
MTWTTPKTWYDNELVTAAMMNQHLRDNLNALKSPAGSHVFLNSVFDTTSTSFVDVPGASITFTSAGGFILVLFSCALACTAGTPTISLATQLDSGTDVVSAEQFIGSTSQIMQVAFTVRYGGVPGSHTMKVRMKVNGGTGRMANSNAAATSYVGEIT